LAEGLRRPVEYRGNLVPQGNEKRRKRRSPDDSTTVVVITVAEAHHLAVGQVPMKVKRLEWEIGKLARKPILLIAREGVRTVAKTLR
jgi:hypothetical protein